MILYIVRAVWIASHICVLIRADVAHTQYRAWCAYIGLSLMMAAVWWPEMWPGLTEALAPWLVAVLLLRTLACLEALHVQTREFPRWSRMMAGAFLLAFAVVLMLHGVRDDRWAGLMVELRRYLQIWLAVTMCAVQLMLVDREWQPNPLRYRGITGTPLWNLEPQDIKLPRQWFYEIAPRITTENWHAVLLTILAVNHGAVSVWAMRSHPEGAAWLNLATASTAVDAAVYLAWSFGRQK